MKDILHSSVFAQASLHVIGVIALTFCTTHAVAGEPDIPRIQAEAERGSIQQEIELAGAYFEGHGVSRDEKQAAFWYEKAANSGDPGAQLQIGFFYEAGVGVDRDPARAALWFERAMAAGSVAAKVNLGVAYTWGTGVRKDPELAAKLFREAADKGSGASAYFLADAYYFGLGVEKDEKVAKHWLEIAAKRHDPQAELSLGVMLLRQSGQDQRDRGMKLIREAAKSGYVAARHELALRLVRQPEFTSTPAEAMGLLQDASSQGFWKSTVVLAVLYRDGRGVSKDPETAYLQFRIAALQGGEAGQKLVESDLRALEKVLATSRVDELNEKAADWVSTHKQKLEFVRYPSGGKEFPSFALSYPEDGVHAGRVFPAGDLERSTAEKFHP